MYKILLSCLFTPLFFLNFSTQKTVLPQICGMVLDGESPNEPLIGATVRVVSNNNVIGGAVTDYEGRYCIHVEPGTYTLEFAYTGFTTRRLENVVVSQGQEKTVLQNMVLQTSSTLNEAVIISYKVPLTKSDETQSGSMLTSEQIHNRPTRTPASAPTTLGATNVKGSRENATNYYVDGIRVDAQKKPVKSVQWGRKKSGAPVEIKDNPQEMKPAANTPVPTEPLNGDGYSKYSDNAFIAAKTDNSSTFSIDVDRAAYSNVRRFIQAGQVPPVDAVRIEEMINAFSYDYTGPTDEHPFAVHTELGKCPWNPNHHLLRIGLKGRDLDAGQLPPSNLVFLLDVSGSMQGEDRLDLVKKSILMLSGKLRATDKVSIVVYAGAAGLVLPSTPGNDLAKITAALDQLSAGGSTAGGAGIQLAYRTARESFLPKGNNRVILCTDGDFNVGLSTENDLVTLIERERESGIYLTVLGFGRGNYQDSKMQQLADKGNGNHAYIDTENEANKVLVQEFGGTMYAIARDVKLQLMFNAESVDSFRLIGYENRMLNREDFANDAIDAGELGLGHTVTALYEIVPRHKDRLYRDLLTLELRYKKPKKGQDKSILMQHRLSEKPTEKNSESFKLAASVAEFGLLLRDSPHKGNASWTSLSAVSSRLSKDSRPELIELAGLMNQAKVLNGK